MNQTVAQNTPPNVPQNIPEPLEPLAPIPVPPPAPAPFFLQSSAKIDQIMPALCSVFAQLELTEATATNAAFRKAYATLADNTQALKGPCAANKIFYTFCITTYPEAVSGRVVVVHGPSAQWVVSPELTLPAAKRDIHGFKSVTTYLKRILLEAAFAMASSDDDANAAVAAVGAAPKLELSIEKRLDEISRCGTVSMLDAYIKSLPDDIRGDERITLATKGRRTDLLAKL